MTINVLRNLGFLFIIFFIFKKDTLAQSTFTHEINLASNLPKVNNLDDLFTIEDITFLELKSDNLINDFNKVYEFKDTYYGLDSKLGKLHIYQKNGKLAKTLELVGEGPDKIKQATDFFLDVQNNKIYVLSRDEQTIAQLSLTGVFEKFIKIGRFGSSFAKENDKWYIFQNMSFPETEKYNLVELSNDGKISRNLSPVTKKIPMILEMSGFLIQSEELLYSNNFSNEIQLIKDNKLRNAYRFNFGKNALDLNFLNTPEKFINNHFKYAYLGENAFQNNGILLGYYFSNRRLNLFVYSLNTKALYSTYGVEDTSKLQLFMPATVKGISTDGSFLLYLNGDKLEEILERNVDNKIATQFEKWEQKGNRFNNGGIIKFRINPRLTGFEN